MTTPDAPEVAASDEPAPPHAALSERARERFERAEQLHQSGRPAEAAELLARVLLLEPEAPCVREALARAQFDAKQFLGSRTSFAAMVAVDAENHYALFGLGLSASRLGDYEGAVRHLQRALELSPTEIRYAIALEHAAAAADHRVQRRPAGEAPAIPGFGLSDRAGALMDEGASDAPPVADPTDQPRGGEAS